MISFLPEAPVAWADSLICSATIPGDPSRLQPQRDCDTLPIFAYNAATSLDPYGAQPQRLGDALLVEAHMTPPAVVESAHHQPFAFPPEPLPH